jgi:tetratricopeptide (TPR) repeat protein
VSRAVTCPNCGERIQPSVGECLFCGASEGSQEAAVASQLSEASEPAVDAAPAEGTASDSDRAFGLLLFEAEEQLARGQGEKAMVLASRAVRERPENVTARALYERARRELLRGRRREKLEARIQEAQALFDAGTFPEAERIVTSALKFLPDHAVALGLLARLKERRVVVGTVEAEAEGELQLLAKVQARHALAAARKALNAGWDRRAMVAIRRGLSLVPGEPELLALLKELQQTGERSDHEAARRRGLLAQIREATELLGEGRLEESLKILRAVLKEDPDNARAQAAIQQVRRAWLARGDAVKEVAEAPSPAPPSRKEHVASAPAPAHEPPPSAPVAARAAPPARGTRVIPPEILLPRSRRRATPLGLVLLSAALVVGLLFFLILRGGGPPAPTPAPPRPQETPAPTPPPEDTMGPMSALPAELRQEIERTLGLYGRALESQDPDLLAQARPDLSAAERKERLAPFLGALNVATDLRVLEVTTEADTATVSLLRTDVIVGGRQGSRPPTEETLRFVRARNAWTLVAERTR